MALFSSVYAGCGPHTWGIVFLPACFSVPVFWLDVASIPPSSGPVSISFLLSFGEARLCVQMYVFPISSWKKQQKVTLMRPLPFTSWLCPLPPLWAPLHLAFWTEVVFTSMFPSLSAFILKTFTELVFHAGVCVCVYVCLCVCLCVCVGG